jgi:serine/threonine-protein kinase HipA
MKIRLEVRLETFHDAIGHLVSTDHGDATFSYAEQYLSLADRVPVSLALPLRQEPFGDQLTRAFFDNLLPENDQLRQVMEREGLDRTDIVGLLYHLGSDCPGALSCIPSGEAPVKIPGVMPADYDVLDTKDVEEIMRRLADRMPLPNDIRDPSPIAGVQQKIAIALLPDGTFGMPKKGLRVPTTHIVKVPRRGTSREARLETAAAQLAHAAGLDVAIPELLQIDDLNAILISRFDRRIDAQGNVWRIHQEDFAQALGLPASLKYQRHGRLGRLFDAAAIARLLELTAIPASSKRQFLAATFFNMMVGNTDNHAKNHALLYDQAAAPRLAPLYDILPIRLDGSVSHQFSFNIGSAEFFDVLTRADVEAFLAMFGMTKGPAARFLSETIGPIAEMLDRTSEGLTRNGLKDFDDLIGREISRLADILGLVLSIRDRDYFTNTAGGWALSS